MTQIYLEGNPYGYKLNIAHSLIRKLYFRYKDSKGIGHSIPLSDQERREFETEVIRWMERRKYRNGEASNTDPKSDTPDNRGIWM